MWWGPVEVPVSNYGDYRPQVTPEDLGLACGSRTPLIPVDDKNLDYLGSAQSSRESLGTGSVEPTSTLVTSDWSRSRGPERRTGVDLP